MQLRKADKATIEKLLPDVKKRYLEATKESINIELLEEYLPADRYRIWRGEDERRQDAKAYMNKLLITCPFFYLSC